MSTSTLQIAKLSERAKLPTRATLHAAGYDLRSAQVIIMNEIIVFYIFFQF